MAPDRPPSSKTAMEGIGAESALWTTNVERMHSEHMTRCRNVDRASGPVVSAAAGDAAGEQVAAVREQVRCHESAIRVAADADPCRIGNAPRHDLLLGRHASRRPVVRDAEFRQRAHC